MVVQEIKENFTFKFIQEFEEEARQKAIQLILEHIEGSSSSGNSPDTESSDLKGRCEVLVDLLHQVISFTPAPLVVSHFTKAILNSPFFGKNSASSSRIKPLGNFLRPNHLGLNAVLELCLCNDLLKHPSASHELKAEALSILTAKLPALTTLISQATLSCGGGDFSEEWLECLDELVISPVLLGSPPLSCHSTVSPSHLSTAVPLRSASGNSVLQEICQNLSSVLKLGRVGSPPVSPRSLLQGPHRTSFPKIDTESAMTESLLTEVVTELGASNCQSVEDCHNCFSQLPKNAITNGSLAHLIITLLRYHHDSRQQTADQIGIQSLGNTASLWTESKDKNRSDGGSGGGGNAPPWNMEVLIQAIMDFAPNTLSAKEVLLKLDSKGFLVADKVGLAMFVTAIRMLSNLRNDQFPIDVIYRKWQNLDEQVLLLTTMLNHPDVFCFFDFPCTPVSVEMLKTVPELDNKEVATWRSLTLVDLLFSLESSHYSTLKNIFNIGKQNCPDVLVLGLIQSTAPNFTLLKQDLLSQLIPIFLEPHPNTAAVLQSAWYTVNNSNSIRQIILISMAEWYMQQENDQTRLSRILDIAQDLKALSVLLNAQPFPFVIDLACLAFRREFLKLDKWLSDKVREHGDAFITALVKFVQQRCPHLMGGPTPPDEQANGGGGLAKATQLPAETISTITHFLTPFASSRSGLNPELSEIVMAICQNSSMMAANRQRTTPNVLGGFPPQDALAGLTPSLAGLSINAPGAGSAPGSNIFPLPTNTAPGGLPSNLNLNSSLAAGAPGSPARGALNMLPGPAPQGSAPGGILQQQPQQPAIGSQLATTTQSGSSKLDMSAIFELPPMVSKEVEDEANSFFQRIYNNPPHSALSINEILDLLKKFHESTNKKEREVYACMLRNLFEEYKFFPTYPHKELFTTARLFGGIIDQGLVEYMALGVALRFVMEALQKPHGSKMYYFGILALDRFKSKLKDYPRYCQHIVGIEHFQHFPPHLAEWVRCGANYTEPPTRPTGPVLPTEIELLEANMGSVAMGPGGSNVNVPTVFPQNNSILSQTTSAANAVKMPGAVGPRSQTSGLKPSITTTNIDTLIVASEDKESTIIPPNEKQIDKIAFIFNNLSQVNLQQKSEELLDVVPDECWNWVSQYLVMKRASIEANFHNLYSNFLDQLKNPPFSQKVIEETLRNIKVLLKLEKNAANFSDKSLLKNLGHWLGLLTLAKNKPILHVDISVKSLLIEAFLKGTQEMQYVVPFVTKVLESCAKSRIFKPPNPWTMAILNVLAEIRGMQDMKLHLKFEIEVLCNKLEISVDSLNPGTVLQESSFNTIKEFQLSPSNNINASNAAVTSGGDISEAMAVALGRGKRAESTPLLPTMPNFPNQSFLTGASGGSVSEGMGGITGGQGSSSAGATPTPQGQLPQQLPSHTAAHTTTPTPASHHLHAAAAAAAAAQVSVIGSGNTAAGTPPSALTAPLLPQSVEKLFSYNDINVTNLRGLEQHISLNSIPNMPELSNVSQVKNMVRAAIEVAVQDVLAVVMERSVRIALSTAETLIKKDFALDPDETHLRASAHYMVRNLTASMAMITCKDYLVSTIAKSIKQKISPALPRGMLPNHEQQMEQIYTAIAQENMNFTCNFIQKTCAEKAVLEADKRLNSEFDLRKNSRADNRHYCDTAALTYQAERMPDQIRLKVGRVTPQQMQIYEDFERHIPGFAPNQDLDSGISLLGKATAGPFSSEEQTAFLFLTERLITEIEHTVNGFSQVIPETAITHMLSNLYSSLLHIRNGREFTNIPLLIKKCLDHLFEGSRELPGDPELNNLLIKFRDLHLLLLKAIADPRVCGPNWTTKVITKCWLELRDELKFNVDVVDWLLRSSLINIPALDEQLARFMEDPRSLQGLYFAMQIVQVYLVDENNLGVLADSDLNLTLDALIRLCQNRQAPDTLVTLLESLRLKYEISQVAATASERSSIVGPTSNVVTGAPVASQTSTQQATNAAQAVAAAVNAQTPTNLPMSSSIHFHSGVNQARDFNDPAGLQEKTEVLLREWIQLYHSPTAGAGSATAFTHFVKQMNLHGILKTDELITRFFRNCVSYCREICHRTLNDPSLNSSQSGGGSQLPTTAVAAINLSQYRNKCFQHIDPFVRLLALLIKHSGEASNPNTKINLLNKVLGLVCGIMMHDIETSQLEFFQLPYHRIFIMLFLELNAPEPVVESINLSVLIAFTQTLHLLRPSKCSGFAYAWLEIVSHRVFIGRMLAISQQKGWAMYAMLLTDLFKFLAPFLRNAELASPLTKLYKGTLRVLLVLLHDFPEFLCEYHYGFCDAIPPNCIQMRNLILSAFPRNMKLPDPFTPNLKVDMLPEIGVSPKINSQIASIISPTELRNNLDSYLKNRTPVTFLTELRGYLQTPSSNPALPLNEAHPEGGMHYNIPLLNALVVYVGMQAIAHIQAKGQTPSMSTIAHSAHMDIFQNLTVDMDTEGRYLFLNAIANQLRYPNSHTHYFSCTLLYLFVEANTEAIQEQITRVLLERLIVNRPHPWGLLITFIELIKNPNYEFWTHEFVKCAPEIEKLFESVARSCMVNKIQRDIET